MKGVYWQPRRAGQRALVVLALISVGALALVETHRRLVPGTHYEEKLAAARLAARCIDAIKLRRIELGYPIDPVVDPAETGLIGESMTSATSTTGRLSAKRISANPNFAAVVVELLERAGLQAGDTVAIGYSGSFPGLNVAVEAAVQTLELRPIGISSVAASQWGANLPEYLWVDMEQTLVDEGLIGFRSRAASLGGVEDRGLGMSDDTRQVLRDGIARNRLDLLEAASFAGAVDLRMQLYQEAAGQQPIKCYINIGGGATSVGKSLGKKQFHSGLVRKLPRRARDIDSVMTRFLNAGVPVIHLIRVTAMAERYGLETDHRSPVAVGQGSVLAREEYNTWYAAGALVTILAGLGLVGRRMRLAEGGEGAHTPHLEK
jgi:poly-gamma-glutamate system protein